MQHSEHTTPARLAILCKIQIDRVAYSASRHHGQDHSSSMNLALAPTAGRR